MMAMTKQEFIAKQQAVKAGEIKRTLIGGLILFGPLVSVIFISNYIKSQYNQLWLESVLNVVVLGWLVLCWVMMLLYAIKQTKKSWRLCPHCHRMFNPSLAIASNNCGHCGEKVFSESSPSQS